LHCAIVLLAAAALLGAGCDRGASYESGQGPPVRVLGTFPADAEKDVPLRQPIRVQFDRFLHPDAVTPQSICVERVIIGSPQPGEACGAVVAEYDPVDRVGIWTPAADLLPNTRYNVRVLAPANADDGGGVRAFDGAPLESEGTFAFETGDGSKQAVRPNRTIDFCAAARQVCALPVPDKQCRILAPTDDSVPGPFPILTTNCSSCHNPIAPHTSPSGASGAVLHLTNESDVRQLVEMVQIATETATAPNVVQRNVRSTFGTNMPLIDANNPGNSFLLYKIMLGAAPCPLRSDGGSPSSDSSKCTDPGYSSSFHQDLYECAGIPDGGPTPDGGCAAPPPAARKAANGDLVPTSVEPWVPADTWSPPAPGEYERLRQRIRGEQMPPMGGSPRNWAHNLSAWIADGAKAPNCVAQ
jgi:hypothetical protein